MEAVTALMCPYIGGVFTTRDLLDNGFDIENSQIEPDFFSREFLARSDETNFPNALIMIKYRED